MLICKYSPEKLIKSVCGSDEEDKEVPLSDSNAKDDDEENDIERDELPTISEQESSSLADRSALIMEEHNKIAKSEEKQNQILSSLTKKAPLPNK